MHDIGFTSLRLHYQCFLKFIQIMQIIESHGPLLGGVSHVYLALASPVSAVTSLLGVASVPSTTATPKIRTEFPETWLWENIDEERFR